MPCFQTLPEKGVVLFLTCPIQTYITKLMLIDKAANVILHVCIEDFALILRKNKIE